MKPVFALLAATVFAAPANAAVVCMEPAEMQAALIDWYQESLVGQSIARGDSRMQLWASDEGGTWTMVRTYDDTSACVVAQGKNWNGDATAFTQMAQLDQ